MTEDRQKQEMNLTR